MKRIGFVLAVAMLLAGTAAWALGGKDTGGAPASSFRTVEDIKASGKVIVGVFSDEAPFGYVDEYGTYQG